MSDIHSNAAPYVLGALEGEDLTAFDRHLDTCSECQAEVEQLAEGLIAMAYADAENPPTSLRDDVLAAIASDQASGVVELRSRRSRAWYLIPAFAAIVALFVTAVAIFSDNPEDAILAAADAIEIEFTATDAYSGPLPDVAQVVFSDFQGAAVVVFAGLSETPANMTYQLWLIDGDDQASAGTFQPDRNGAAIIRLDGKASFGHIVGITQEPRGGSPAPTGNVLFFAEL